MLMDAVKNEYVNDYQNSVNGWSVMMDRIDKPNMTITTHDLWVNVCFDDILDVFIGSQNDCHISTKNGYLTIPMDVLDVLV